MNKELKGISIDGLVYIHTQRIQVKKKKIEAAKKADGYYSGVGDQLLYSISCPPSLIYWLITPLWSTRQAIGCE